MAYNVKPGDRARIINSVNGTTGSTVGRLVRVYADRAMSEADAAYVNANRAAGVDLPNSPYDLLHTKYGKIWPVRAEGDAKLVSEHGGVGEWLDVPDAWLQREPESTPTPGEKVVEKELQ